MRTTSDIIAEISYDAYWDSITDLKQEVLQMDNNINAWEENGRFYFSDGTIVIETVELVDVDSLEFVPLALSEQEFPPARFSHAGSIDGDKLWIHGGRGINENGNWFALDDVWYLDLSSGDWTELVMETVSGRVRCALRSGYGNPYERGAFL